MSSSLLLTKSNIRKNKGSNIANAMLMVIGSILITLSLLIFMDFFPNAKKDAKNKNSGDLYSYIYGDVSGINASSIMPLFEDDIKELEVTNFYFFKMATIKFGDGTTSMSVCAYNEEAFDKKMAAPSIVMEDKTITSDYVYVPYQFYTGGGEKIGNDYEIGFESYKKTYKIKGFIDNVYGGCNNVGSFAFIIDDESYKEMSSMQTSNLASLAIIDLYDDSSTFKFLSKFKNTIEGNFSGAFCSAISLDDVIYYRSFIAQIFGIVFLVVSVVIVAIVILMMISNISNYVKTNLKNLGALKAIGYTSKDIRASIILQFFILSILGGIVGTALGYGLMPILSKTLSTQQGIPYCLSFKLFVVILGVFPIAIVSLVTSIIASRKIKKINPIVALREGIETHNFKKNNLPLENSKLGLNISLSLKAFINNLKQNILVFFVSGLLIELVIIGIVIVQNFSVNPPIKLFTTEICDCMITVKKEKADEVRLFLENDSDVSQLKNFMQLAISTSDEDELYSAIVDDMKKYNNTDVCYKGRLPKFDNEIAISGKYAKEYGYEIGETINLVAGSMDYDYLITGYIQTVNNSGKESILTREGIHHIYDESQIDEYSYYMFDIKNSTKKNVDEYIENIKNEFGEYISNTTNFYTVVDGALTTFKSIFSVICVVMNIISILVLALTLYVLIKIYVFNKRKDYGIYKALGYRTKDLVLQTALSFMPAIIISTVVFTFVGSLTINDVIGLFLRSFGIMKCTLNVPALLIIISSILFAVIAFLLAIFLSRRIKKIEPYKLLIGE